MFLLPFFLLLAVLDPRMKCVAYLRVSDMDADPNATDPQADLEAKVKHQRDWAVAEAQRQGWDLVKIYVERFTGTASSRPQLDLLRKEIALLGATRILVYGDDRLGRDDRVTRDLVDEFDDRGIQFHFGNISLAGFRPHDAKLMFGIKALITGWDRDNTVWRLGEGAKRARESGTLFGSTIPNHFKQTPEGLIVPDADAFDMYERRESNESTGSVAAAHRTYEKDVQRTVRRVRLWKNRPPGTEWKRGKKVLRALRDKLDARRDN